MQIWIEPEKNPEACRIDKQLPFAFLLWNEGKPLYGHAIIPGVGPPGLKIGGMGGYGTREDEEVLDVDNVAEVTKEDITNLYKEVEGCIPACKGKVIHH